VEVVPVLPSPPNFGLTSQDYARHRAGFPDSFFERLAAFDLGLPGQLVVDLGTGTGSLARGFAKRGCQVIGIDIAAAQLEQALALDKAAGVVIDYSVARAEETGLEAQSVDVVTAGQCWHWFDRPRAAIEVARVLRTTGSIVIAHFDWIPLPGNVAEATEKLIASYSPTWKPGFGLGLYPVWLRDLGLAGFRNIQTFSYDMDVPYTHEAWRGRVRASAGVGAILSVEKVRAFDEEFAGLLASRFPAPLLQILHRVWAVTALAPSSVPAVASRQAARTSGD
jgi:SAM-dependent methyltransferase